MFPQSVPAAVVEVQLIPGSALPGNGAIGKLPVGSEPVAKGGLADSLYDAISVEDIERAIGQICGAVAAALDKVRPESCSVEFSMGFKAGAKIPVLVNGEANATFKVTLNWKRPAPLS